MMSSLVVIVHTILLTRDMHVDSITARLACSCVIHTMLLDLVQRCLVACAVGVALSAATPVSPGMKSFGVAIKQAHISKNVEKTVITHAPAVLAVVSVTITCSERELHVSV